MSRTRGKRPIANRGQKTIQMLDFATNLHRKVTGELKENRTVVASAAMLAFAQLPVEKQLDHIRAAREQLAKPEA